MTVHAHKGQQHPIEKSRQLQRGLYLAAKRCKKRRFHALYDRMSRSDVLWRTYLGQAAQGLESRGKKVVGKPYEGEPHVRFEVAGVGNVIGS